MEPGSPEWMAMQEEWRAWQTLCKAGLKSGAWTQKDLDRPVSDRTTDPDVSGLLDAIRNWGEKLAKLRRHQPEDAGKDQER